MLNQTADTFTAQDFTLENGVVMPELTLAYETYGTLSPTGDNAVLVLHGFASHHRAGGDGGWLSGMIGDGCAIDTDSYFVIAPNMLGSSFGSTGPQSEYPATGAPYGPDFPEISIADIVDAEALLLDHLGVGQLAAIVGYSYGGYLTFQWGVRHPQRMRALIPVASRPQGSGGAAAVAALEANFSKAEGWNDGRHYGSEAVFEAVRDYRAKTLRNNGMEQGLLAETGGDAKEASRILVDRASDWARQFDPNSLIALRRANTRFDVMSEMSNIVAPMLYVLCSTDNLFPAAFGPERSDWFRSHGVNVEFFELDSPHKHRGPLLDWAKWDDVLSKFLAENN
jgi:homoserine O-acetyltransferase/O-succinyltransferase